MAASNSNELTVLVTKFSDRIFWLMYFDCPLSGKRFMRSTKQTTEREARKAAAKWEAELNEGRYKPKSKVGWSDFRELFLSKHLTDAPAGTYNSYTSALNAFERVCRPSRLTDVTAAVVAHAAAEWRKAELSNETIAAYLRHLKAALNWAVKEELLISAPRITMPKRSKGQKLMKGRPITTEEFERMLAKAPDEPTRRLLRGLWLSGLRLGEALNLSWDDPNKITVELDGKRPMLRIYAHHKKGGRDTLLPITPDFAEFLLQTPREERRGDVFRGGHVTSVSKEISAIGEAAGIIVDKASGKYASAHDLRRAFGVRWALRVMPAVLKEMMRHSDIGTTMKYYAGISADTMADTIWEAAAAQPQTSPATP
jgi:integrase